MVKSITYHADEYVKSIKPIDARIELIGGDLALRVKYEITTNYQKFNVEFPNIQLTARSIEHMIDELEGMFFNRVTLSEDWFVTFQCFPEVGESLPFRIEFEETDPNQVYAFSIDPYQVYEAWLYKMEKGGTSH